MKIKKKLIKQIFFAVLLVVILGSLISCGLDTRKQKVAGEDEIEEDEKVEEMDYPIVIMETSMGNIEIELYDDKAPITVKNFLSYVESGFYDGLIFHRVIDGFMVQGGGFDKDMNQKQPNAPIKNEADNGLKNEKFTLAMARTGVVDSATSQFFINIAANAFLDNGARDFGYAVFGKVIGDSVDTVIKIKQVETTTKGMHQNVPVEPVVIEKAYVKE